MTASLQKLTAGNGYEYLTRQVAANDATGRAAGDGLADYYSAKGEQPGHWVGRGVGSISGVEGGDQVSAEQMKALFGQGRHPNADTIESATIAAAIVAGAPEQQAATKALTASRLGTPFKNSTDLPSDFTVRLARAYKVWLKDPANATNEAGAVPGAVPPQVRAQLRTRIATETFTAQYGREPLDARELSGHVARESRPRTATVAGYDMTFSPVKSVSVLWALGNEDQRHGVEAAHQAAVQDALDWLEQHALFTRRGKGGARLERTTGLVAASFTHRDSRAGDPDLHTHVAISNKVRDPADGSWLAIHGAAVYAAKVTISEVYNTALEQHLGDTLGVRFGDRDAPGAEGKRAVREVVGVPTGLCEHLSKRRVAIRAELGELAAQFKQAHGRAPTPDESITLAQQATLATRDAKHEPRSLAEQLVDWRADAGRYFSATENTTTGAGQQRAQDVMRAVPTAPISAGQRLDDRGVQDLARRAVWTVQQSRAVFKPTHITSEVQRRVRALGLSRATGVEVAQQVLAAVWDDLDLVRVDVLDPVRDPAIAQHVDGSSKFELALGRQYTTTAQIQAEQRIVAAATAAPDRFAVPETTASMALLEATANGTPLDAAQAQMVTQMACSGRRLQLALAPAGSGKTTTMKVLTRAWQDHGGTVLGLAPTAVAAQGLRSETGATTDNLAKMVWHIHHPGHRTEPEWMGRIGPHTLLIVDEAGMAATSDLDTAITYATSRGASVRLIGDDRQLAAVSAGGVLRDIQATAGAQTLTELHRFRTPGEPGATLALRDGHAEEALGFLLDHDRVHVTAPEAHVEDIYTAHQQAVADGSSASRETLRDGLPEIISEAQALESPRVTVWWAPCDTREEVLRDAELYNRAGAALAAEGLTLCYHNHEHEFQKSFSGVSALDVLAEHTDPAALAFEIDIAWVTFGGEDAAKVLRRYAGRVPAIHVKDLSRLDERGHFTTVGTGVVPIQAAVAAALETGVEALVVEQDTLRHLTGLETAAVSYLNLKEMGLTGPTA